MKIKLADLKKPNALTHLMLESAQIVDLIINTPEWKDAPEEEKAVNVTVQFNGVEADPEALDKLITDWYVSMGTRLQKQYEDVEAEIERRTAQRVQAIVEERLRPIQDEMYEAANKINSLMDRTLEEWEK